MKEEISTVLGYLECEREMFLLRNQFLSLGASQSSRVQETVLNLLDAINRTNIQSHKHAGFYYLFLGCAYYEQGQYESAALSLQSSINEMWGSQVNKALARWLLGLCYSNMQDFPRARNEMQEALQLLATHRGTNSPRTDREYRSRQTIRQNIKDAFDRLFNEPFFRVVRPDPAQSADRFPVQNPPTGKNDAFPISIEMPISVTNENYPAINTPVTVTNENYPVNKLSFHVPSERSSESQTEQNKDYESRTDQVGYMVLQSLPIYRQKARAGKSGEPEMAVDSNHFPEITQIFFESKPHTIHSLRSKTKRVNVTQKSDWGWIKVKGKSMNKIKGNVSIDDGDYVLFQSNPNADDNDIVIAVHEDHNSSDFSTLVKRLRKSEKMLYSETSETGLEYGPIDIENNNMQIIGIVYAVAKPISS